MTQKKLPYEILNAPQESFFRLSSELGDIAPFRRILSIMRLKYDCQTIIKIETNVSLEGKSTSCNAKKNNRRCNSCHSYIEQMRQQNDNLRLISKKCVKFYFFSCGIDGDGVFAEKHQEHFLGFCIIHQDKIQEKRINAEETYIRTYVPECVIKIGINDKDFLGYKYGNISSSVSIDGQEFNIDKGNYFSQQNGITNCCAHAAIKTALRGYDDNISCDELNKVLIDSKKSNNVQIDDELLEISRMARGLTPHEMLTAIKDFSRKSDNLPNLEPFLVTAHDLPITNFVETIYRAIESKLPVILLLRIPDNLAKANSFSGHAISLVGHTFNEHNWCAYGSGYFSAEDSESYLSSYLWCDNYVVQDDNFGPAYHLPCNFLTEYYEYGVTIEKLGLNIASKKFIDNIGPNYPLAAIIIPPANLQKITEKLYAVEQIAAKHLVRQLNTFRKDGVLIMDKMQQDLFDRYFYYIFKYKRTKPRIFITRTLLVSKEEYLESDVKNILSDHSVGKTKLIDVLDEDILPDFFWVTEISVPELYWINNRKIGEIIIDAEDTESKVGGIRLIRLPFFLALYPKGDQNYYPIHLDKQSIIEKPHHHILRKRKGIIRQSKETI